MMHKAKAMKILISIDLASLAGLRLLLDSLFNNLLNLKSRTHQFTLGANHQEGIQSQVQF